MIRLWILWLDEQWWHDATWDKRMFGHFQEFTTLFATRIWEISGWTRLPDNSEHIETEQASLSPLGNLFQDIKDFMKCFQHCSIQFAHRQCNNAAHNLTRHTWNVDQVVLWFEDVPDFLSQIVWFEKKQCFTVQSQ